VASVKPELDKLNIELVAVGSGTPVMAKNFKSEFKFPGMLFVDQKKAVYDALGCNRGVKYALSLKALKAAKQSFGEGFRQGSVQGDSLQLGGVFILSKTEGLLFQHVEEYSGHHVDVEELKKAAAEAVKSK